MSLTNIPRFAYKSLAASLSLLAMTSANAAPVSGGVYVIKAQHSGKCMDVSGISTANGAPIIQWSCTNGNNQKWRFTKSATGNYTLQAVHSNKCLDVKDVSTADNAILQQWDCAGSNNQQWAVVDNGDGSVRLLAGHSGKAADVYWGDINDGAKIVQYQWVGGKNQRWILTPADSGGTNTGGGGSSTGGTGGVTVYQHSNFGGYAVTLPPGRYNLSDMNARGIANDDLSSARIPAGYTLQLFNDANFTGLQTNFTQDISLLPENDKASSIVVLGGGSSGGGSTGGGGNTGGGGSTDSGPYNRQAAVIPGTLEAENYDYKGFRDTTAGNSGTAYRQDDVDIEASTQNGFNVGWTAAGEWLQYTVNVSSAGNYQLSSLVASQTEGGQFQVMIDGNSAAIVNVPVTNGWQNWQWINGNTIALSAGQHVIKVSITKQGFNFNALKFTSAGGNNGGGGGGTTNPGDNTSIPVGRNVMSLVLKNNTNGAYPNDQVYWAVIGYDPVTRNLVHVDANGNLIPAAIGDNDAPNHLTKQGQNYSNYFYRMSDANWVSLPKIDSGRMYLSLGSPIYIKINRDAAGRVAFAGPDLGNPSDPSMDTYFEWIEFTIDDGGYHGNTTRVDQFGFPLTTRLVGNDGYDKTFGETESRTALMGAYQQQVSAPFRTLNSQAPYRIIAPAKGSFGPGRTYGNYFDNYIAQIWQFYAAGNELAFNAGDAGTFRGRVIGNDFVFSRNGGPANIYIHGRPTTLNVLEGSGNLAAGSVEEKVVQAQMTAAINRHLLLNVDPNNWSNASYYYQVSPSNEYSKFWHDHSLAGKAYGFCYDDVRDHSTLQETRNPKGLIVGVGW